ncbi:hypothetical protein JCGZ_10353 [Jatropha curcas]|uniref:Uncharacterized protein n=1 Tax=Jatropha curcas TaxID=180498 RepID=A0A067KU40_JATCU|nr:hypothetical protein JCGZ_10353 [Jatropha curcas]
MTFPWSKSGWDHEFLWDKDVQVLHDQSGDENFEDIDSGASEVKGRKENVRIPGISSDFDEGELLGDSCGYPVCSPGGPIRPNPTLTGMAPKKTKSSKMAKVAEAMKKQAAADSSRKEVPPAMLDP